MFNQTANKYKPEIIAFMLLTVYTVIRTLVVARGISPVSDASWLIFLIIEVVTAGPYVWAVGDIVRKSLKGGYETLVWRFLVYVVAAVSFAAPYVYLMLYGALQTPQGASFFLVLILLFMLPTITKYYVKLSDGRKSKKRKRV